MRFMSCDFFDFYATDRRWRDICNDRSPDLVSSWNIVTLRLTNAIQ